MNVIKREDWTSVFEMTSVDEAFAAFHSIFMHYFDICFSLKRITVRKNNSRKQWVDLNVIKSSQSLKELYKLKQKYPEVTEFYREQRRQHAKLIRSTKSAHYQSRINNSDNPTKEA